MKKQNNIVEQITDKVYKQMINEAEDAPKEEKDPHEECDDVVNRLKKDLKKLKAILNKLGVTNTTNLNGASPIAQVNSMYEILCDFEPSHKKFVKENEMQQPPQKMRNESDLKVPAKMDRNTEKKAVDMSKKYDMDIQMGDEMVESIVRKFTNKTI